MLSSLKLCLLYKAHPKSGSGLLCFGVKLSFLFNNNRMPMIIKAESVKSVTVVKSNAAHSVTREKEVLMYHWEGQIQAFRTVKLSF